MLKKSQMKHLSKREKYQFQKELKKEKAKNKKDDKKMVNALFSLFVFGDIPDEKK